MKRKLIALTCFSLIFCATSARAIPGPPLVSYNVSVIQNTTPDRCPASWRGDAGIETAVDLNGFGESTLASPAVRSCTGCKFVAFSKSCVCDTCYDYADY